MTQQQREQLKTYRETADEYIKRSDWIRHNLDHISPKTGRREDLKGEVKQSKEEDNSVPTEIPEPLKENRSSAEIRSTENKPLTRKNSYSKGGRSYTAIWSNFFNVRYSFFHSETFYSLILNWISNHKFHQKVPKLI